VTPQARNRRQLVENRLRSRLDAVHLEVEDESAQHAGHLEAEGGGSHFRVLVVSPRFEGLGRVAVQRLVYEALEDLMVNDIHALQIRTYTPRQWLEIAGGR
jgi:BolA protein